MKQINNETLKNVKTKVTDGAKSLGKKTVDFGKKHWKGILLGTGGCGALYWIRRKAGEPEPMDFEQDTIENAQMDFGENYLHPEAEVEAEEVIAEVEPETEVEPEEI